MGTIHTTPLPPDPREGVRVIVNAPNAPLGAATVRGQFAPDDDRYVVDYDDGTMRVVRWKHLQQISS